MITQAPRGVEDWYGDSMHKRSVIEKLARELADTYNMSEIITPIFEHTVLFQRGVGETTDVVQKEMYTFTDKGNRSITLKPEGTSPVMRAYLEHNMYAEPAPTKLYYVTPAFRYEKPQSGRLRQHHQFGVEFVGSKSPLAEVELITLITTLIGKLGLKDAKLHINSIGCANCRKTYNEALCHYLKQHEYKLCPTCKERMQKNPLRVIDCKVDACKEIVKDAPRTIEYLDTECKEHWEELKLLLDELNIPYEIDTGIVRGLDYYTKTVFEFVNSEGFTLCGGGRYDGLIHEIDEKQDIPSVGFGMGIERILYFLEKEGVELEPKKPIQLYVGILGKEAKAKAYKLVNEVRSNQIIVETDYMDRSVKAQMKYANKLGAKYTVIIGTQELDDNRAKIKEMDTGEQIELALDEIAEYIIKQNN
ncbi:histidyl-tRNA synthetase [Lachnotalea glycerini]|uniref:Histidine--tRNA ligase n=1 Tax=Lachnotalea glycerini TaxID=1763509 RepID=A0A318ESR6_9FIRM|nr:histidine--tRNA ligase [Lachnotalea glycerini]PXV96005.1 histidyl-tRNA synthetase [Lachnotalea glycerini]